MSPRSVRALLLGAIPAVLLCSACAGNPAPGESGYRFNLQGSYDGALSVQGMAYTGTAELSTAPGGAVTGEIRLESPEAVTVSFDLGEACSMREFRLWFSDDLPEVTLEVSADGQQWAAAGQTEAQVAGEDVLDVAVPLHPGAPQRYLRASFAAREPGRRLTLVEAEVWGDAPGG